MKLKTLHDLYVAELQDLYNAETQIIQALPKMMKAATSPSLQNALQEHLTVTEQQVDRLKHIFEGLGESPKGRKCKAMEGIIAEGEEAIGFTGDEAVHDAALIASAQRVEHYEIAGYGTVRTFAEMLGYTDAAELLQQTLDEEGDADKLLTEIAETEINEKAIESVSPKD